MIHEHVAAKEQLNDLLINDRVFTKGRGLREGERVCMLDSQLCGEVSQGCGVQVVHGEG